MKLIRYFFIVSVIFSSFNSSLLNAMGEEAMPSFIRFFHQLTLNDNSSDQSVQNSEVDLGNSANDNNFPDKVWINTQMYNQIKKVNNREKQNELKLYKRAVKIGQRVIYVHPCFFKDIKDNSTTDADEEHTCFVCIDLNQEGASLLNAYYNKDKWANVGSEVKNGIEQAPQEVWKKTTNKINKDIITPGLRQAENRVERTLDNGAKRLEQTADRISQSGQRLISGIMHNAQQEITQAANSMNTNAKDTIREATHSALKLTAAFGSCALLGYIAYKYFNKPVPAKEDQKSSDKSKLPIFARYNIKIR